MKEKILGIILGILIGILTIGILTTIQPTAAHTTAHTNHGTMMDDGICDHCGMGIDECEKMMKTHHKMMHESMHSH